jgi:hypothetical protein
MRKFRKVFLCGEAECKPKEDVECNFEFHRKSLTVENTHVVILPVVAVVSLEAEAGTAGFVSSPMLRLRGKNFVM